MTVFYTSDTHFNHPFVAKLRGFDTAEEHDEHLIESFNRIVKPSDSLWILGDLFIGHMDPGLLKVGRLNGHKHLILGNHDAGHPMHKKSHTHIRRYFGEFESVQLHDRHQIGRHIAMVSHFPYDGDHTSEDRDTQWRLRNQGLPIIHGHVHSTWAFRTSIQLPASQVNVGVDVADFHPISREQLEWALSTQSGGVS